MKRFTSILICILLLAAVMILPVSAEGSPAAALTSASGAPGSTVTLNLSLSGFEDATSIGFSVDTADGLSFNAESSGWNISGTMQDISGKNGVWASGSAVSVNGSVATLAFTVPTPAAGQTNMRYTVTVTVTVKNADTGNSTAVSASGSVTVVNPATGLNLDKSSLALDMKNGTTTSLTATVTPANTSDSVVWSSSDSSVATVSSGTVTAKKPGSATITATAGSVSASCTVTVTCSHNLETHTATSATCQVTGNNLYYTCTACGVVLDANMNTTTVADQTLAKVDHSGGTATCTEKPVCTMCSKSYGSTLPHSYATAWSYDDTKHWHICTGCSTAKSDNANHSLSWVIDTEPTEDSTGLKHQECACGYKTSLNTVIDKLPHTHVGITYHAPVAATCKLTGNVEYWTCSSSKCTGKYYGDANCANELTTVVTPINSSNHVTTERRNVVSANCYTGGYTGDIVCVACNTTTVSGTATNPTGNHTAGLTWVKDANYHWHNCTTSGCIAEVDKAQHSFSWVVDKAATEDETGLKHEECACGYKRNENTVIAKLDHVHVGIQHHAADPATCVSAGTVEYWTCSSSKCAGKYYGDSACQLELTSIVDPINSSNHTGATELKDKVEPTCSTGGYSGDLWCTSCSTMIKEGKDLNPTGKHTPEKEYGQDKTYHWQICSQCDCVIGNAKVEHTFTWVFDKKPTESATGVKHQECTVCGYKTSLNTVAEKLKHIPYRVAAVAPTCEEDGMAEHYYCGNCGGYYLSTDGKIGKWVKQADLVLPATGHTYSEEWTSDEQIHYHSCQCGGKSDEAAHTFQLTGAVEATETDPGYTGDEICEVCGYVKSTGQEIPCIVVEETTVPETEEMPAVTLSQPAESKKKASLIPVILLAAAAVVAVPVVIFLKKRK